MTEREYGADLKEAIALSPEEALDWWEHQSRGISFELVPFDEPYITVFPEEQIPTLQPICVGLLESVPLWKSDARKEAHREFNVRHRTLLSLADGLTEIFRGLDQRVAQGKTVPKVLFGLNMNSALAKLAYRKLGFYYLGEVPFERQYDMVVATDTLRERFEQLKAQDIHGKTLYERLEKWSNR